MLFLNVLMMIYLHGYVQSHLFLHLAIISDRSPSVCIHLWSTSNRHLSYIIFWLQGIFNDSSSKIL